ncbi:hypothetical protein C882_1553 [Caenispirillum salinarum AK4]|uniref:Uncharacterized protein n=1 Tax=Caenispirillum salinarum AK4 TaxID=1238182 RepID=K9HX34_9PROT|nr:hypothetical protein C882_1553 [Caenispirillum salinarum AK4]
MNVRLIFKRPSSEKFPFSFENHSPLETFVFPGQAPDVASSGAFRKRAAAGPGLSANHEKSPTRRVGLHRIG